jgi:regulator of extracellular matrix RemA (YlzA/DUF370 family)
MSLLGDYLPAPIKRIIDEYWQRDHWDADARHIKNLVLHDLNTLMLWSIRPSTIGTFPRWSVNPDQANFTYIDVRVKKYMDWPLSAIEWGCYTPPVSEDSYEMIPP